MKLGSDGGSFDGIQAGQPGRGPLAFCRNRAEALPVVRCRAWRTEAGCRPAKRGPISRWPRNRLGVSPRTVGCLQLRPHASPHPIRGGCLAVLCRRSCPPRPSGVRPPPADDSRVFNRLQRGGRRAPRTRRAGGLACYVDRAVLTGSAWGGLRRPITHVFSRGYEPAAHRSKGCYADKPGCISRWRPLHTAEYFNVRRLAHNR
jgi:hypothetical protein